MRRSGMLVFGLLLLVAGCQGINGPFAHKRDPVQVDNPHLTLDEQKVLGRDRLALPELSTDLTPRTDTGIPR